MDTEGLLAPESPAAAAATYETIGPAAQTVVRATTRSMGFDREEYGERVDGEVIETARDALFASLLTVHVGSRAEFEAWLDGHPAYEAEREGSERVDRVVWHPVAFADRVVAAAYQSQRDAAVGTLRRISFGRHYRPAVESERNDGSDGEDERERGSESDGNEERDRGRDR